MARKGAKVGFTHTTDGKYIKNVRLKNKIYSVINKKNKKTRSPQIYSLRVVTRMLKNKYDILLPDWLVRQFIDRFILKGGRNKYHDSFLTKVNEGTNTKYYLEYRYAKKI